MDYRTYLPEPPVSAKTPPSTTPPSVTETDEAKVEMGGTKRQDICPEMSSCTAPMRASDGFDRLIKARVRRQLSGKW